MKVSIFQLLTQSYADILPWYLELLPVVFTILFIFKLISNNIVFYTTMHDALEDNGLGMFILGMTTLLYVIIFLIAIFYKFPIVVPTT